MKVPLIDARAEKGVALQIDRLALVAGGHPHVTNEHVRQTSKLALSHTIAIRQRLSCEI